MSKDGLEGWAPSSYLRDLSVSDEDSVAAVEEDKPATPAALCMCVERGHICERVIFCLFLCSFCCCGGGGGGGGGAVASLKAAVDTLEEQLTGLAAYDRSQRSLNAVTVMNYIELN